MNDCSSTEEKGGKTESEGKGEEEEREEEEEEASCKRGEEEAAEEKKRKALEGWPAMLLVCEPGPWRMIPIVLSIIIYIKSTVERENVYL